jgi:hypothetical protein
MPLMKIFSRKALTVSADTLHNRLTKIWKVPDDVLKVLIIPTHDMSSSSSSASASASASADGGAGDGTTDDDCDENENENEKDLDLDSSLLYVDIRAKAKPERTKDVINNAMINTQNLLKEYGYNKSTIRIELYEPSLQSILL